MVPVGDTEAPCGPRDKSVSPDRRRGVRMRSESCAEVRAEEVPQKGPSPSRSRETPRGRSRESEDLRR